jgi:hypothetical protein
MSINYIPKVNERLTGQAISNEPHIIGIVNTVTYAPGFVRLVEVPQAPAPLSTVSIPGYTEIMSGIPTGTQFLIDYETGVITFATAQDGNSILVSYIGLGSEFAAEDVNEIQNPLGTIASQSITYNWPLAPTATWALAPLNQALNANSHKINNVTDPASVQDAATKNYVDTHILSPGGSNTQIQYNNLGAFGGASGITTDGTNLTVTGNVNTNTISGGASLLTIETSSGNLNTASISISPGNALSGTYTAGSLTLSGGDGAGGGLGASLTLKGWIGFPYGNADAILSSGGLSSNSGNIIFQYAGTEIARMTSSLNMGIGTSTPNASALIDMESTTKGFLPPRMTTTQRNVISSPAAGLIVYNTTDNQWEGWNNSAWVVIG